MANWRLLVVDDDPEICAEVKDFLERKDVGGDGSPVQVDTADFEKGFELLQGQNFDLLILDVRRGEQTEQHGDEAGLLTLQAVKAARFVPVVFYTALPQHIPPEIQTPVVRVVKKTEGLDKLLEVAQLIFATKLPVVNRALVAHVRNVQRDYMWDFVAKHWDQFGLGAERTDLAYFLARRLAFSLSGAAVDRFVADLPGEQGQAAIREGMVHPMRMYLIPPIQGSPPQAGDLFTGTVHGKDGYWLLLTPSCDVAQNKAIGCY
jgi:CheY-like chemotaxis protein